MNIKKYKLVPLEEKYLDIILTWRNSERIRKYMYTDDLISIEEHKKWYNKVKSDKTKIVLVYFNEKKPLGLVNFYGINKQNNHSYWGFYIGEENTRKGTGLLMAYLALDFIFHEVKMNKLIGEVLEFNKPSIAFHQKLGFIEEKKLSQHVVKNNEYIDVYRFALYKEIWEKNRIRIYDYIEKVGLLD